MASERFVVRVTKDHLVFCSGHFISYAGHQCERLHGHNYRATVEVEGPLDENFYVFDFIALKQRTKEITDELDHRMLLATANPIIKVEEQPSRVRVTYKDREWVFPREDCVLRPMLETRAARHPERRFALFEDGTSWTYGECLAEVRRAAAGLQQLGEVAGGQLPPAPMFGADLPAVDE